MADWLEVYGEIIIFGRENYHPNDLWDPAIFLGKRSGAGLPLLPSYGFA